MEDGRGSKPGGHCYQCSATRSCPPATGKGCAISWRPCVVEWYSSIAAKRIGSYDADSIHSLFSGRYGWAHGRNLGDTAGHMVAIWATGTDCQEWLRQARILSDAGPTPAQVAQAHIERCIKRLSDAGYVQSYSGEIYGICAGVGVLWVIKASRGDPGN